MTDVKRPTTADELQIDRDTGDIRLLRSFVAVARAGSFSAAATSLHLTQQAVSQHVSRLERQLGVELLERTTRHVAPTPVGEQVLAEATDVLVRLQRLWDTALAAGGTVVGTVTLGMSPAVGHEIAPQLLAAAADSHPNVRINVVEQPTPRLLERLRAGELDLALALSPGRHRGLNGWPVVSGPMELLLAHDHPLAARASIGLADLRKLTIVIPPRRGNAELHSIAVEFANRAGLSHRMESLGDSTLPEEVYFGSAYALWPSVLPHRYAPGGLVVCPSATRIGHTGMWLMWKGSRPPTPIAAVIDEATRQWPPSSG